MAKTVFGSILEVHSFHYIQRCITLYLKYGPSITRKAAFISILNVDLFQQRQMYLFIFFMAEVCCFSFAQAANYFDARKCIGASIMTKIAFLSI